MKMENGQDTNKGAFKNSHVNIPNLNRGRGRHRGAPVEKAKDSKKTLKRLWKYIGNERKVLMLLLILIIISSTMVLLAPYLIGSSIDAMALGKDLVNFSILKIMIFTLTIAYIVDGIIKFVQDYIIAGVSQRIVKNLRSTLFGKLQKLPISFFDSHTHGEVMSRLTNDIENVSITISESTLHLMSSGLTIIGSFIMMLILSPILTFASLITIPLVFILTNTISKRTKVLFKEQQRELGRLNGHIEEAISGISVIKAFNHEDKVIKEFEDLNSKLCNVGIKAQVWSGYIMPLMNVINNIGFTAVAGVGGILAVNDNITIGIIASFLSYSRQFGRPLNDFASIFNTLQSAIASGERVFEFLDEREQPKDCENAFDLVNTRGKVRFDNVSFSYDGDSTVIKGIDFEVSEGSTIALVGPTGGGKTTIVNLLSRFYDVTEGKILIDDIDIREYKRDSLRNVFGIVLQDTYLFHGTIMENIKYGKLDASEEEVKKAAIMANAHSFISRLPKGYNTLLSESGGNLSQGQKQLIAIARAILSNPSILILDEATSNVDTRTELHIQEAMIKLMEGRTSFIIAHRLSTIRDADKIMVIDNGNIVEVGNHNSLLDKKAVYYNLYISQFKNI